MVNAPLTCNVSKWRVDPVAPQITMSRRFRRALCGLAAVSIIIFAGQSAIAAEPANAEPIRVILVGDSTMATRTGYGDALCQRFRQNVTCINVAKGGRSSGSFRAEGLWDQVMERLRASGQYRATYVLIQFGHNDQPGKPGRSTDLVTEFPVNIARYVGEAKSLGTTPVLVTPLTRRIFQDGILKNDLAPWAESMRRVATAKNVPLIDLNAKSTAAVAAMGSAEADTLAEEPPPGTAITLPAKVTDNVKTEPTPIAKSRFDYTHLGEKGAMLFAHMVGQQLVLTVPTLAPHIKP